MVGSAGVAGDTADDSTGGEVIVGTRVGLKVDLGLQPNKRIRIRISNTNRVRLSVFFTSTSSETLLGIGIRKSL